MKKVLLSLTFLFMAVSAYGKEFTQAYEDKLIQDLKGIYTQEAIKTPDNPTGHPVDATPIILQARHDFPFLSAEAKKAVYPFPSRPSYAPDTEYAYNTPSGYFKIHFAKEGVNAVYQPNVDNNGNGIPDYVDTCAAVLDHIWAKEIDSLGYNVPPSDGWYPVTWDNGGDGRYDIYLLNLGSNYLGATHPETTSAPNPALWSYTSWIELDNNYTNYPAYHPQYDWLRVTAAHEFFHAIQMGYDVFENEVAGDVAKPYWMEMSATWMENEVYDYINDYIYYLRSFLGAPWVSLRNFTGLHPYGAVVWPIYLGERFGINIIKDIWTKCAEVPGDNVLSATDTILSTLHNSSLNSAFREFSVWNYFTGDRANPSVFGFYSEGPLWVDQGGPIKVTLTNKHTLYPATDTVNQLPQDLGSTYLTFVSPSDTGGLRIYFEGDLGPEWSFSIIGYQGTSLPPWDTVVGLTTTPSSMNGMGLVIASWRFTEVPMVIARGDTISTQNYQYRSTAQFDPSLNNGLLPPSADRVYQNFPNPFVITDANSTTKFPLSLMSTSDVKLFIFTGSGELVWKYSWRNLSAGNYDITNFPDPAFLPFQWDGRNLNGEYVASGIYLYRIVTNGTSTTKKLVVINER
ncbi:MAG: DUF6055 domain-containing protein [candidate division Zixibacteria bacterium]|nr:DUF6055 domain-containing protein [candidate division Zixibacteria bacterium]